MLFTRNLLHLVTVVIFGQTCDVNLIQIDRSKDFPPWHGHPWTKEQVDLLV